ncbi:MAG: nickel-dependent lactate racemase [Victivallales bacterium]|nr:nickel-dependent lactate racemase [Victivallales bacterium]
MIVRIPYGHSPLEADIPDERIAGIYESRLPEPSMPEAEYVRRALDAPIGSPRLEELARGKKNAVIITSDHTRPVPSRVIMPQILERLRKGQPNIDITILVATGCHRPTTKEELVAKLGEEIVANEHIVLHDSKDDSMLEYAGTLPSGGRLVINKLAMQTELLVTEGFIEPHFFAGFSGGRKSVLPGIVSRETVLANHCSEFIQNPFARTGSLENNPIHKDMLFAAKTAKLAFIVNVVIDHDKRIVHAVAGDFEKAHLAGCAWLEQYCKVEAPQTDIVITSNGGYPLDQNAYQSVKGMTSAEPLCRQGGVIIIAASCSDGHGGEAFYNVLSQAKSAKELYDSLKDIPRDKTTPDQWQYQILARIMMTHTVIVVTRDCDHNMLNAMHLCTASTLEEALRMADAIVPPAPRNITVLPDGVSVICQNL